MTAPLATVDADAWFPFRRPAPVAPLQLFCLPFAGGGASRFLPLARMLEPAAEVLPVQFPGRENRMEEPAYPEAERLVGSLAAAVTSLVDRPYAVLGYSLGALYGFELVLRLQAEDAPTPSALFAVAAPAPQHRGSEPISRLPDAALIKLVQAEQSIPQSLLDDPELLAVPLAALRTDLSMWEHFRHRTDTRLNCPIFVYTGRDDRSLSRVQKIGWRERTAVATRFRQFDGGHFFGVDEPAPLAAALRTDLDQYVRGAGR
jgi:medium-chain acyl-[acyl-carrier-protein] hydrolase